MPTISNKANGKSWTISDQEADQIANSQYRHLYTIQRVYEPDEVKELKAKIVETPVELPEAQKKKAPRKISK